MLNINSKYSFIKTIRLFRILRPLKFLSHNPNMRILVNCLIQSMQGILNVTMFIFVVLYFINLV
jgi:hypothetical protein